MFGTSRVKDQELLIGGVKVSQLKEEFGSPLYIIDQKDLERRMETFVSCFQSKHFDSHVIYASKAFTNLYVAGLANHHGLYLDVVSGGELYVALEAGVPASKIYFHGNNKTPQEISEAIQAGVGTFVIDNAQEVDYINELTQYGQQVRALLRINPGIEAKTHSYIQTTTNDSKFGVSTDDDRMPDLIQKLVDSPTIDFKGLHCHVGSQITDETYFFQEAQAIVAFAKSLEEDLGLDLTELNLGGGFGVQHTPGADEIDFEAFLPRYIKKIEEALDQHDLSVETISIEPGRSMINNSGYTLYTVGHIKHTLEGLPIVAVDGGMSDNLRPALYQADYHAVIANRMEESAETSYRVAGKLCESGDILIQEAELAQAQPGDLLVIPASGAYTYAMSSNYNMMPRPAVVFVKESQAKCVVPRQSYQDLVDKQVSFNL